MHITEVVVNITLNINFILHVDHRGLEKYQVCIELIFNRDKFFGDFPLLI